MIAPEQLNPPPKITLPKVRHPDMTSLLKTGEALEIDGNEFVETSHRSCFAGTNFGGPEKSDWATYCRHTHSFERVVNGSKGPSVFVVT